MTVCSASRRSVCMYAWVMVTGTLQSALPVERLRGPARGGDARPRGLLAALTAVVVAGCAGQPIEREVDARSAECLQAFERFDAAVAEHGSPNARFHRIEGFPQLRTDRFTSDLRHRVSLEEPAAFEAWIGRLARLGEESRAIEWATIPAEVRQSPEFPSAEDLARCAERLTDLDARSSERRDALVDAADPADDYSVLRRTLGLYPVTRFGILLGVHRWQAGAGARYSAEPPEAMEDWTWYLPPEADRERGLEARRLLPDASRDALGVPQLDQRAWSVLFAAHAPIWAVEEEGGYDRIGTPGWATPDDRVPRVLPDTPPVTYRHGGHAWFDGEVVTQLTYGVWFPERPRTGPLDLLGGHLSGVLYRVTLDGEGRPLLYDTVHHCGCYHQFHPTDRLLPRNNPEYAENPLVLPAPVLVPGERMVVGMRTRTHYVEHLFGAPQPPAEADTETYRERPYEALERLPVSGEEGEESRRSLFDERGIVPGTERRERWVLWPAGVPNPGAKRQWGRHMTAFVGKRHFDDPDLIERIFRSADGAEE